MNIFNRKHKQPFILVGALVAGFIFFTHVSTTLAVEPGLTNSFTADMPYLDGNRMVGSGSFNLPSNSNHQRQLKVCLQHRSSSGAWGNTDCDLFTGTNRGAYLFPNKSTSSASTKQCWRTWAWYWTSYDNTSQTRTSTSYCGSYRRPYVNIN